MNNQRSLGTDRVLLVSSCLFIALCVTLVIYKQRPPDAVPAGAPVTEFASGRALQHLKIIAQRPHPIGSADHEQVCEYLVKTLTDLGLQPEIQETVAVRKTQSGAVAGSVKNIVARLKGTEPGKAILLVAHYDSVANSYGASDDGSGVATILETLRALKTGPPLKNDVLVLLSDGEESGMLGARAFVNEHPLFKEVGLVLNFEARGSDGPVLMFETSERNGLLIRELSRVAPHPFASSFFYDVYKQLPNDTDLSVFKNAGLPGLNFAYLESAAHYHTLNDSLETIDERSIQHHGSYSLNLTRHLGNLNLSNLKTGQSIYFDLLGSFIIAYPSALVIPLCVVVLLLFAGAIIFGLWKKQLTVRGIGFGVVAFLLAVVAGAGVVAITWKALRALHSDYTAYSNAEIYFFGFVALALCIGSALYFWVGRYTSVNNLIAGALTWWAIVMVLASVFLAGTSYIFTWPLLFGVLAFAFRMVYPRPVVAAFVLGVSLLPALVLLTSTTYGLFQGVKLVQPAVLMLGPMLLFGLLLPLLRFDQRKNGLVLTVVLLLTAVGLLAAGNIISPYNSKYPKSSYIVYSLNADSGEASWGSDRRPDEWTSQFFDVGKKNVPVGSWTTKAPALDLPVDKLEVVNDRITEGVRVLDLRITSARGPRMIIMAVENAAEISAATVQGKRIELGDWSRTGKNEWELSYAGIPKEGVNLSLTMSPHRQVKIRVASYTDGLPQVPGFTIRPRPNYIIPSSFSDVTRVARTFVLAADDERAAR